ncbi:hypothetical protein Pla175_28230 [Pirellulimonas nuda]|uniref:Tellurite resistance protein TerB n=1 Tax=Pirellulimonas nuda TaxID=2528009 RepID=A0A518DDA6_9BACT|nr:TMEM43 family protein [Pirellulimonas nuda]QDU89433.1 hypothetical protein Pla175_28230 [Pirellulimonas nuda]
MARERPNGRWEVVATGSAIVVAGVLALWENEGRFDFYRAARDAPVVQSAADAAAVDTFSLTGEVDTQVPIEGRYVKPFASYLCVDRAASVCSWHKSGDSDWKLSWGPSVPDNARNQGVKQTLRGGALFPTKYLVGDLEVHPDAVQLVDDKVPISGVDLPLTQAGRQAGLLQARACLVRGNLAHPRLGDERLDYTGVPNAPVATYFGKMDGRRARGKQFDVSPGRLSALLYERYLPADLMKNDGVLHHLVNGDRRHALGVLKSRSAKETWLARLGGAAVVVLGVYGLLERFSNLLYHVPVLGQIARWGMLLLSVLMGAALSLLVVAVSAMVHHPWALGPPLALVAAGAWWLIRGSRRAQTHAREAVDHYQHERLAQASGTPTVPLPAARDERMFSNLIKLAVGDGLGKRENRLLVRWGKKHGITKPRMQKLFAEAQRDPAPADAASRDGFILMVAVALADGKLSVREQSVLVAMAARLGISKDEVRRIIVGVATGELLPV